MSHRCFIIVSQENANKPGNRPGVVFSKFEFSPSEKQRRKEKKSRPTHMQLLAKAENEQKKMEQVICVSISLGLSFSKNEMAHSAFSCAAGSRGA